MRKTAPALTAAAGDALRRAYTGDSAALREAAVLLVDLRELLDDWRGRGGEYRAAVAEAYSRANVPPDDMHRFQNAVRHHTSRELRDRLTDAEMEEYGLVRGTYSERKKTVQHAKSAALAAVGADPEALRDDLPAVLAMADALLEFAETQGDPDNLTRARRGAALLALSSIIKRAQSLQTATRGK